MLPVNLIDPVRWNISPGQHLPYQKAPKKVCFHIKFALKIDYFDKESSLDDYNVLRPSEKNNRIFLILCLCTLQLKPGEYTLLGPEFERF